MPVKKLTPDDIEQVLFGNLKKNKEKDTDVENDLLQKIRSFVWSHHPTNKANAFKVLNRLKTIKKYYPDDLIPKAKTVYRGTYVSKITYELVYKKSLTSRKEWISLQYTYQPKSKIQSWTTNRDIAESFVRISKMDWDEYSAILQAKVDNSFIMNSKLMNLISQDVLGEKEDEIIRINAKPINVIIQVRSDWIQEYYHHYR